MSGQWTPEQIDRLPLAGRERVVPAGSCLVHPTVDSQAKIWLERRADDTLTTTLRWKDMTRSIEGTFTTVAAGVEAYAAELVAAWRSKSGEAEKDHGAAET